MQHLIRTALLAVVSLLAIAAVAPAIAAADYRSTILADNPSAYWRLGETAGATTLADETLLNPGTKVGAISFGRTGPLQGDTNTAAGFNGTTDTVQVSNAASLNPTSALSIEAWVKPAALPGSANYVLRKDGQYGLYVRGSGGLTFRVWKAGVAQEVSTAAGLAPIGVWTHVAATWDGATMTIYVNGVSKATAALAAPSDAGTTRLWLGSTYNSYGYLAGDLDEVAIFPSALSAARVAAHFQAAVPPPAPPPPASAYATVVTGDGPTAYWRLGDSGAAAADLLGGSPGSFLGGVVTGRPGAISSESNTAIGLNGTTATAKVPSTAALMPVGPLTVESWIRPTAYPASSNSILRKDGMYALRLKAGGAVVFRLWKGGVVQDITAPTGTVPLNAWAHVVGVWDGTTMTLYVNGVAKATGSVSGPTDITTSTLWLGSTYNSFDYFAGDIDETAVYAKALTAARVTAHYTTVFPPPPPLPAYVQAVSADGANAHWRLGDTGTTAADRLATTNGTYVGGVTTGRPGAIAGDADTAIGLNGTTGTVSITSTTAISPTAGMSIETWVRPSAYPSSSNTILRKEGAYTVRLTSGGAVLFRILKGGVAQNIQTPGNAVRLGVWSHVVGTWDGTTMRLYVDGVERVAQPLSAPIDTNTSKLWLGSTYNSFDYFAGDLDEVAIYDHALSEARIIAHAPPRVVLLTPASGSTMDDRPNFGGLAGRRTGDNASLNVTVYSGPNSAGAQVATMTAAVSDGGAFSVLSRNSLAGGTYTAVATQSDSTGRTTFSSTTFTVDAAADPQLLTAGDIANCRNAGAMQTVDMLSRAAGTVLANGDLAYEDGLTSEFNDCYDPTWGTQKARTRPAVGNHEYSYFQDAAPYYTYWGSRAGDPTQGWYSYDVGTWHIIVLNSECARVGGCGAGSPQEQWLRADLLSHPAACTLAYFHEPRFSSGLFHGVNTAYSAFWQALEDFHADVVFAGHDHIYERFAPQTAAGVADAAGIREFVVGTGGAELHPLSPDVAPNSEVRYAAAQGIMKLQLHPTGYSWDYQTVPGAGFSDAGTGTCH